LQGDGAMVLMLGRGEHCPRERQHQREMLHFYEWCSVAFTQLVTVLPNDLHDVDRLKISTGAHWSFLADRELELQRTLGIREYTAPQRDATVPPTVVLSHGRVIEKVYGGYRFWGRPSPYQLWQDLQELSARSKADFDPTTDAARAAWEAERWSRRPRNGGGHRRDQPADDPTEERRDARARSSASQPSRGRRVDADRLLRHALGLQHGGARRSRRIDRLALPPALRQPGRLRADPRPRRGPLVDHAERGVHHRAPLLGRLARPRAHVYDGDRGRPAPRRARRRRGAARARSRP